MEALLCLWLQSRSIARGVKRHFLPDGGRGGSFYRISLILAVLSGRNNNLAAGFRRIVNESACVAATIRQSRPVPARTIRRGARRHNKPDRHVMRIRDQVYFTVGHPFARPIPWFPPLDPAARGRTLR